MGTRHPDREPSLCVFGCDSVRARREGPQRATPAPSAGPIASQRVHWDPEAQAPGHWPGRSPVVAGRSEVQPPCRGVQSSGGPGLSQHTLRRERRGARGWRPWGPWPELRLRGTRGPGGGHMEGPMPQSRRVQGGVEAPPSLSLEHRASVSLSAQSYPLSKFGPHTAPSLPGAWGSAPTGSLRRPICSVGPVGACGAGGGSHCGVGRGCPPRAEEKPAWVDVSEPPPWSPVL